MIFGIPSGYMRVKADADVNRSGAFTLDPHSESFSASRHIEIEDEKYGLGDLFFAPVLLGSRPSTLLMFFKQPTLEE
jgi:hypothetical protein